MLMWLCCSVKNARTGESEFVRKQNMCTEIRVLCILMTQLMCETDTWLIDDRWQYFYLLRTIWMPSSILYNAEKALLYIFTAWKTPRVLFDIQWWFYTECSMKFVASLYWFDCLDLASPWEIIPFYTSPDASSRMVPHLEYVSSETRPQSHFRSLHHIQSAYSSFRGSNNQPSLLHFYSTVEMSLSMTTHSFIPFTTPPMSFAFHPLWRNCSCRCVLTPSKFVLNFSYSTYSLLFLSFYFPKVFHNILPLIFNTCMPVSYLELEK